MIVVTGGAGFIGSTLINSFADEEIILIDSFSNEAQKAYINQAGGNIRLVDISNCMNVLDLFKQKHDFIPKFKMSGNEYGFIPNLDEITYGENKDVTAYINDWETMHKAMAVLFRPVKQKQRDKYIIEDYEGSHKYSEVMKDMPLDIVMGAMVFFYNLTNVLLKSIPSFLEKEMKKEQMQGVISPENGEAIQNSILLLRQTLQDLNKLQSFPYINA